MAPGLRLAHGCLSWRRLIRGSPGRVAAGMILTMGLFAGPDARSVGASALPVPLGAGSVPNVIDSVGQSAAYAAVYGGMAVTNDETHIDVYLTSLSPAIESAFETLAPSGTISFIQTPNSVATLGPIDSDIVNNWSQLLNDGIKVYAVGGNVETGTIDIEVEDLTQPQVDGLSTAWLAMPDFSWTSG